MKKKRKPENNCVSYVIDMAMNWHVCMTSKICTWKQEWRVGFTASYICKLTVLRQFYSPNQFMTQSNWSNDHYQIIIVLFLDSSRLKPVKQKLKRHKMRNKKWPYKLIQSTTLSYVKQYHVLHCLWYCLFVSNCVRSLQYSISKIYT